MKRFDKAGDWKRKQNSYGRCTSKTIFTSCCHISTLSESDVEFFRAIFDFYIWSSHLIATQWNSVMNFFTCLQTGNNIAAVYYWLT